VAAAIGLVTGAPSTTSVRPTAKTPPIPKKRAMKPMAKVPAVKTPMKKGSLAAINAAASAAPAAGGEHTREVFVEMPERYTFSFFSPVRIAVSLICCAATQRWPGVLHGYAQRSIRRHDQEQLGDYENGHIGMDDSEDVEKAEEDDDELEEVDAGTYEEATEKEKFQTRRTSKYTEMEDEALIKT
jgi:hypothetical protein